jgi:integrase
MRQAGSIIKKRKRWYAVYKAPDGKQKWEGGYLTKGQAQDRLTEALGQIHTGDYIEPSKMTLSEFAGQWIKNRITIEGNTREGYESYIKLHIKPSIGAKPIGDIRHSHIQEFVAELTKKNAYRRSKPLSPKTIIKIMTMLNTVFKSAVKNELIRNNPVAGVELPKAARELVKPPEKADVLAILAKAPAEYKTIFLLDATTGLRRGEILALQWKDVDWINREIRIERAIKKAKGNDGAHKWTWIMGTTKSGRSRRVGLAPIVIEELQALRASAKDTAEDQFIFTRNGSFIIPEYFSQWIALPLVKEATEGRVKRFHDLRHFFASALIDNGESPKYVQDQVGHASISTTLDIYTHLWPQAKQQATKKLERSLFGKKASFRTFLEHSAKKAVSETVN